MINLRWVCRSYTGVFQAIIFLYAECIIKKLKKVVFLGLLKERFGYFISNFIIYFSQNSEHKINGMYDAIKEGREYADPRPFNASPSIKLFLCSLTFTKISITNLFLLLLLIT